MAKTSKKTSKKTAKVTGLAISACPGQHADECAIEQLAGKAPAGVVVAIPTTLSKADALRALCAVKLRLENMDFPPNG